MISSLLPPALKPFCAQFYRDIQKPSECSNLAPALRIHPRRGTDLIYIITSGRRIFQLHIIISASPYPETFNDLLILDDNRPHVDHVVRGGLVTQMETLNDHIYQQQAPPSMPVQCQHALITLITVIPCTNAHSAFAYGNSRNGPF